MKKQDEIGNLQGIYLIFYFKWEGSVKIENTKYDHGLISKIVSIVISVGVVIYLGSYNILMLLQKEIRWLQW